MTVVACGARVEAAQPSTAAATTTPVLTATSTPRVTPTAYPTTVPNVDLTDAEAVAAWQQFLVKEGYGLSVDGIFGPVTAAATSDWQRDHKLPATGKLDQATFNTMTDVTFDSFLGGSVSFATPTPLPTPDAPAQPTPAPTSAPGGCHPSYDPCLTPGIGDYDCAGGSGNGPNYTGRVSVFGWDEYDLDRDGNGVGCQ